MSAALSKVTGIQARAEWTVASSSSDETEVLGRRLGQVIRTGHVVGLVGPLGAGKTCFARGLAEGAEVAAESYVSSPTFTLVNEYAARVPLIHIDFYRLGSADELIELGIDDYWGGSGACLIEWYDRFADALPKGLLRIEIGVVEAHSRCLRVTASDSPHVSLLRAWRGVAV